MVVKWEIYDPDSEYTWTFDMNPGEGGTPSRAKNIAYSNRTAPGAGQIMWEGQDQPLTATVSGTILQESQYHFYNQLFDIRHQVELTDDLGRVYWIYITDVQWNRIRRANHPWAHQYTMNYTILDIEE